MEEYENNLEHLSIRVIDLRTSSPAHGLRLTLFAGQELTTFYQTHLDIFGFSHTWRSSTTRRSLAAQIHRHAFEQRNDRMLVGESIWFLQLDTGTYFGYLDTDVEQVEILFKMRRGEDCYLDVVVGPRDYAFGQRMVVRN